MKLFKNGVQKRKFRFLIFEFAVWNLFLNNFNNNGGAISRKQLAFFQKANCLKLIAKGCFN